MEYVNDNLETALSKYKYALTLKDDESVRDKIDDIESGSKDSGDDEDEDDDPLGWLKKLEDDDED